MFTLAENLKEKWIILSIPLVGTYLRPSNN